jgi:hypothetical protein
MLVTRGRRNQSVDSTDISCWSWFGTIIIGYLQLHFNKMALFKYSTQSEEIIWTMFLIA